MSNNRPERPKKPQTIITTGFTRDSHPLQRASYVIFFGDILIFYLFLVPLLHNHEKVTQVYHDLANTHLIDRCLHYPFHNCAINGLLRYNLHESRPDRSYRHQSS